MQERLTAVEAQAHAYFAPVREQEQQQAAQQEAAGGAASS
jgi:hypothetical protein